MILPSNTSFSSNGTAAAAERHPFGNTASRTRRHGRQQYGGCHSAFASAVLPTVLRRKATTLAMAVSAATGGPADYRARLHGDNSAFGSRRAWMWTSFGDLRAGEHVVIDATTPSTSSLTPGLRLFDANGEEWRRRIPRSISARSTSLTSSTSLAQCFLAARPVLTSTSTSVPIAWRSAVRPADYHPEFDGSGRGVTGTGAGGVGRLTDGESFRHRCCGHSNGI